MRALFRKMYVCIGRGQDATLCGSSASSGACHTAVHTRARRRNNTQNNLARVGVGLHVLMGLLGLSQGVHAVHHGADQRTHITHTSHVNQTRRTHLAQVNKCPGLPTHTIPRQWLQAGASHPAHKALYRNEPSTNACTEWWANSLLSWICELGRTTMGVCAQGALTRSSVSSGSAGFSSLKQVAYLP
jgi:hypothetical protein